MRRLTFGTAMTLIKITRTFVDHRMLYVESSNCRAKP
jgi:hypothetical protein